MEKIITREELKRKIDGQQDFVLIDALGAPYYRHSHLPGAINLPLEFVDEASEILPDKDVEIIVYCMDTECPASEEAAQELETMGYVNVRDYVEGKQGWVEAGLPTEGQGHQHR